MENDSKCPVVQNKFYLPKIRALASPLYVFFPHCMPFFTYSSVFHTLSDLLSNLTSFFLTLYSFFLWMTHFFIHSTIHSILCGKIFIQKNSHFFPGSVIQIQNIIHSKQCCFIHSTELFIFLKSRVSDRATTSQYAFKYPSKIFFLVLFAFSLFSFDE